MHLLQDNQYEAIVQIFFESAETSGIIVFLIGVSNVMSWVMAFTGIPQAVSDALLGFTDNPYVILMVMYIPALSLFLPELSGHVN